MSRFFKETILTKGLILVSIPLLFELTFGVTMFCLQSYYRQVIAQESKAKAIIYHANEMWLNTTDACVERIESSLFGVKHSQEVEEKNIQDEFEILRGLVADEPLRLRKLKKLKRVCLMLMSTGSEFQQQEQNTQQMQLDTGIASLRGKVSSFKQLQSQLKAFGRLIREFREPDELKSQDAAKQVAKLQSLIEQVIVGAVFLSVIMNGMLLLYFMKGINRGILALLENTKRMARREPLLPELKSEDEFGFLDRSFHAMAKAVDSATRRQRATINNAADMICVLDQNRTLITANPAFSRKLLNDAQSAEQFDFQDLLDPEQLRHLNQCLDRTLESGSSESLELKLRPQNGELLWTSWALQWSAADQEYFCIAHDVTEMKRMQQMKQDFFGMISHDMRTPLQAIVASIESMLAGITGTVSAKGIEYLTLAEQNGQYLLNLVQNLLDIERLASGAFPLKKESFDIYEIFDHAAEMLAPLAARSGLTVKVPEGSYNCIADRDALTRVVVNLLSNAIKFSPAGSSVDLALATDKEHFKVEIVDHGKGIPPEQVSSVFDRFKQISIDDHKQKGGSGLGLAICKGFVEAHGGKIGVKSSPGEGSCFWFSIPLPLPES